jgi:hypothetical protein
MTVEWCTQYHCVGDCGLPHDLKEAIEQEGLMTDYSEPLSDAPAQLSRLTVLLATRRWVDALAIVDGMLRRLQTVRDWLVVKVESEK